MVCLCQASVPCRLLVASCVFIGMPLRVHSDLKDTRLKPHNKDINVCRESKGVERAKVYRLRKRHMEIYIKTETKSCTKSLNKRRDCALTIFRKYLNMTIIAN